MQGQSALGGFAGRGRWMPDEKRSPTSIQTNRPIRGYGRTSFPGQDGRYHTDIVDTSGSDTPKLGISPDGAGPHHAEVEILSSWCASKTSRAGCLLAARNNLDFR